MAKSSDHFLSKRTLYGAAIILWLVAAAAAVVLYVGSSVRQMQLQFHHIESAVYEQLAYKLTSAEAVLDGFAAFHGDSDSVDQLRTRRYARQLLQRFPHLDSLRVSQRVSAAEIPGLELRLQRSGFPRYRVQQRGAARPPAPAFAYPLVFVEPLPPGFDRLLGQTQDVSASSVLLNTSGANLLLIGRRAGIDVDRLVDLMDVAPGSPLYVSVAVAVDALRPQRIDLPEGLRLVLRSAGQRETRLFEIGSLRSNVVERALFPRLSLERGLTIGNQPLVFECDWQLGFADIDAPVVFALLALALLALLALLLGVRHVHRVETRRAERETELYDLAIHDPLTGLYNRYYLERRLKRAIDEHRNRHSRFGLVYVDLDRFKPVNDLYGHETGDQVLRVVAARLKNVVRQRDVVARIGGDEFVVMIEAVGNQERVAELTRDLAEALAQPIRLEAGIFEIDASTGVAFFPDDGSSPDQLLMVADKMMYAAKQLKKQTAAATAR